jgi:hypothetical protein
VIKYFFYIFTLENDNDMLSQNVGNKSTYAVQQLRSVKTSVTPQPLPDIFKTLAAHAARWCKYFRVLLTE